MYLILFVLNKEEYLNKIMEKFLAIGISGATILTSKGMGRTFLDNTEYPIVGGLRKLIYHQSRPNNLTIFSLVEDSEKAAEAAAVVEEIVGDLKEPGRGIFTSIPVGTVKGFPKE
ncbi:MAG: hypothetical protein R6U08_01190 [Bacillota bacterium]